MKMRFVLFVVFAIALPASAQQPVTTGVFPDTTTASTPVVIAQRLHSGEVYPALTQDWLDVPHREWP